MDDLVFSRMLDEIYGAFNRRRPDAGSAAYSSLYRRVVDERGVPNEAARSVAYAICEYDSLPVNLGKAILSEYERWLSSHPELRVQASCCRECSSDIPGFFWVWVDGCRKVCKCSCNQSLAWERFQPWTRRKALENGFSLYAPEARKPVDSETRAMIQASILAEGRRVS